MSTRRQDIRRPLAFFSSLTTTAIQRRNPWVVAFFSFSYPGFGSLLQQRYLKAFILILWELFINQQAKVNLAIMYSLQGHFELAKAVINERWFILYVSIYMYAIWDSYRSTVDLNKIHALASKEPVRIPPLKLGHFDINFLDKKKPILAVAWSILFPGLGQLYVHKIIAGLFIFVYTITICYYAHLPHAIHFTLAGHFAEAKAAVDMQWLMYLPSIYWFIVYDAYVSTVDLNLLFEREQSEHLRAQYQPEQFIMPI